MLDIINFRKTFDLRHTKGVPIFFLYIFQQVKGVIIVMTRF